MKKFLITVLFVTLMAGGVYLIAPETTVRLIEEAGAFVEVILFPPTNIDVLPAVVEPGEDAGASGDKKENYIVVLDPGHGGSDPGASNPALGVAESYINLKIAESMRDVLSECKNLTVYLTRGEMTESARMTLDERAFFAREKNADIFISLHCNATFENGRGSEVYVSGTGTAAAAESFKLAKLITQSLGELGLRRRGVFYRMSQDGSLDSKGNICDFYGVIRQCGEYGMISMLVEHCFLNESDLEFIGDDSAIASLGRADAEGLMRYLGIKQHSTAGHNGDADGDGRVGKADIDMAAAAVLCDFDAVIGDKYDALDIDGDGLIEADDLARLLLASEAGGTESFGRTVLSGKAEFLLSTEAEELKKGKEIVLWMDMGGDDGLSAAVGTLDYNTADIEFTGTVNAPKGFIYSNDENMGVVRFAYNSPEPSPHKDIRVGTVFRLKDKAAAKKLSLNMNLYSAARIEQDVVYEYTGGVSTVILPVS